MNGETETTMNENGYGYGDGWSMIFGSEHGDVKVLPGQWVTRHSDGTVEVTDEEPLTPQGGHEQ